MAENNRANTSTSTQIRNMYSDGVCYLNISFFNTNLSFKFYKFLSKDNVGRSTYDLKNGLSTTVNFEGAAALFVVADDIINGKIQECNLPIPCAAGAELNLERKLSQNGTMETIFSITKNGMTVPFIFNTMSIQVKVNGQVSTKVIETGLEAFKKTIDGYLSGINAERHLNKLTDDYVKATNGNNSQGRQQNGYNNSGNNNRGYNNNYRRQYNNNNGGRYNNNNQNNNGNNNNWNQNQNLSTYQIKN